MGFARRSTQPDPDPVTTQEWRDSIRAVAEQWGEEEARRLLHATVDAAKDAGVDIEVVETPTSTRFTPTTRAPIPGFGDGRAPPRHHPLERHDDGHRATSTSTALAATSPPMLPPPRLGDRLQPLLPRQGRRFVRRPPVLAGPRSPGIYARLGLKAD